MPETPWFTEPPEATLKWSSDTLGHLHFIDPNGEHTSVPVTEGPSYDMLRTDGTPGSPVWHIEVNGDMATVSPSVHFIDRWHSPNPVQFKLVEKVNW